MFQTDDELLEFDDLLSPAEDDTPTVFTDPEEACKLIAKLINKEKSTVQNAVNKIRTEVSRLMSLLSEDAFTGELEAQRRLTRACNYLTQSSKIKMLDRKIVVSLGGQFSAGKSMFINSISGIGDLLPRAQEPTTSIPTYIIHGSNNRTSALSVFGYSRTLTQETMQALTHEFYSTYHIAFAPFLDCIVAQSKNFSLDPSIALLDTPGYNKADSVLNERTDFSDKKIAYEQLHITDYLIWLVDIENGVLQQSDIEFIHKLALDTPILIVFTKADKLASEQIEEILALSKETVQDAALNCFGVTAYSSYEKREYVQDPVIPAFFQHVLSGSSCRNDMMKEFIDVENMLLDQIRSARDASQSRASSLKETIQTLPNASDICSLSTLWGKESQMTEHYNTLLEEFQSRSKALNATLQEILTGGDNS